MGLLEWPIGLISSPRRKRLPTQSVGTLCPLASEPRFAAAKHPAPRGIAKVSPQFEATSDSQGQPRMPNPVGEDAFSSSGEPLLKL